MKWLEKQVYVYSIGTEAFYTDEEMKLHNRISKLHFLKNSINEKIKKNEELIANSKDEAEKTKICERKKSLILGKTKLNEMLNQKKVKLKYLLNEHRGIRLLRKDCLGENKKIGMFDSVLTRTLGLKINELSTDLFVVRVYYYQVLKDLIEYGFTYNGEKYIYFSSSAGQIRTKKGVFIKESLWKKHEGSLTCGLSVDEINKKGGSNVNKLLAYKALTASASMKWNGFDIDKTIVVPDLETNVTAMFDYINRDTYEITRQEMSVPIEHTDGCGMILPKKSKKAFMVRLPYIKGLLVPFSFDKFAIENNATKVTDIYGKEWDVIKDDIQVIFTASQFKMKKYYDDWADYKKRFKENRCQAAKLNEEDIGEDATLNYQMLQTLTDVTKEELEHLAQSTINDILKIGSDKETMLRVLGATENNKYKNYYQQALYIYPELLNDNHSKKIIKDKKKAMVNDARAGKLRMNGKYTFLIPDLYAFCERLFLHIDNPKGLLLNGEVYCSLFKEGKVDILRSPHLYKEHCVRNNTFNQEREKWFMTNGIYTSIFDPISRILQFDNDGDKALVIQDDLFISIAERNMKDIVPLFYEMGVAGAETITNRKIYDSLLLAFKANIGEISNNITKVFNSNNIDLRVVKWLTAENNYIIDFAKTLYMPKRPEWVDKTIKKYIKSKVPYFFIEAKGKEKNKVEPINNSTVNKLRKIIPNKRIKFEEVAGKFDYRVLMNERVERIDQKLINKYDELVRSKKKLVRNKKFKNKREGQLYVDKYIKNELLNVLPNIDRVVNILVEELYGIRKSKDKTTLWNSFGDILVMNIRENLKGTKQCESCGKRINDYKTRKYCNDCAKKITKINKRNWKRKNSRKNNAF